jgi:hypothetical protein
MMKAACSFETLVLRHSSSMPGPGNLGEWNSWSPGTVQNQLAEGPTCDVCQDRAAAV